MCSDAIHFVQSLKVKSKKKEDSESISLIGEASLNLSSAPRLNICHLTENHCAVAGDCFGFFATNIEIVTVMSYRNLWL